MARKVFVNNSPLKELLIISLFTFIAWLLMGAVFQEIWITAFSISERKHNLNMGYNVKYLVDNLAITNYHVDTLAKMVQQQQYELDVITEYIKTKDHQS